ncbi:MAG: hypothetical protein UGF89_13555 [Acutalibacteraceae bacterium]|nr:hypothetical protein [Acutalibacteraceae bacterium]
MKKFFKSLAFLTAILVIVCSLSITSFAAKDMAKLEKVDNETLAVVVENNKTGAADEAKFVLYVGKEFAGRHFTLETDAGMAPHAYTVNKDGYIEFYFETGSSSKFELALLDNKEPTVNSEKLETVSSDDEITSEETEKGNKTDKEEKDSIGTKLAILVAILVLLGGVYFFMCKKNGYPLGFKKKKGKNSYGNNEEF